MKKDEKLINHLKKHEKKVLNNPLVIWLSILMSFVIVPIAGYSLFGYGTELNALNSVYNSSVMQFFIKMGVMCLVMVEFAFLFVVSISLKNNFEKLKWKNLVKINKDIRKEKEILKKDIKELSNGELAEILETLLKTKSVVGKEYLLEEIDSRLLEIFTTRKEFESLTEHTKIKLFIKLCKTEKVEETEEEKIVIRND